MPYIIDGNNLVGSAPDMNLTDPDVREKVSGIVKRFQESRKSNVVLVFDGEPGKEDLPQIKDPNSKFSVVFPRMGDSADDEIKKILNRFNYFKDVILVTSDRELKSFAKKKGAKTVNAIEFYFELKRFSRIHGKKEETKKRIETELSDNEVDQWMKIFDSDDR
ncbi:MAG: hypothetical protein GY765_06585 [bacterium]|nr:hypothetical protein [bacterium]